MEQHKKKEYIAPEIKFTLIELEETIASGSATAKPTNNVGVVKDEWEQAPDDNRTYNW